MQMLVSFLPTCTVLCHAVAFATRVHHTINLYMYAHALMPTTFNITTRGMKHDSRVTHPPCVLVVACDDEMADKSIATTPPDDDQ